MVFEDHANAQGCQNLFSENKKSYINKGIVLFFATPTSQK